MESPINWTMTTIDYEPDTGETVLAVPTSLRRHAAILLGKHLENALPNVIGDHPATIELSDPETGEAMGVLTIAAEGLMDRANPDELRRVVTNHANAAQREAEEFTTGFEATAEAYAARLATKTDSD